MKNTVRKLSLFLLLLSLLCTLFSGCGLSDEQRHEFCETYSEETQWIDGISGGAGLTRYLPIKEAVGMSYSSTVNPYAVFRVTSAEDKSKDGDKVLSVTIEIEEVLLGDPAYVGSSSEKIVSLYGFEGDPAAYCDVVVGQRGVAFLQQTGDKVMDRYTAFLLTEDEKLVSAYGCTEEEVNAITPIVEQYAGDKTLPCYYVGKSLDDLRKDVKAFADEAAKANEG